MWNYNANESEKPKKEDDMFLGGGFEAGMDLQQTAPVQQSFTYDNTIQRDYPSVRHTGAGNMSFFGQLGTAFVPPAYYKYQQVAKPFTKQFAKQFAILTYCMAVALLMIALLRISGSTHQTLPIIGLVVGITISGFFYCLVFPLMLRLSAWIFAWIARLLCLIFRADIEWEELKKCCLYALVPSQLLGLLVGVITVAVVNLSDPAAIQAFSKSAGFSVFGTLLNILPLIMITIAIPFINKHS